jgi:hypothetical protein
MVGGGQIPTWRIRKLIQKRVDLENPRIYNQPKE